VDYLVYHSFYLRSSSFGRWVSRGGREGGREEGREGKKERVVSGVSFRFVWERG